MSRLNTFLSVVCTVPLLLAGCQISADSCSKDSDCASDQQCLDQIGGVLFGATRCVEVTDVRDVVAPDSRNTSDSEVGTVSGDVDSGDSSLGDTGDGATDGDAGSTWEHVAVGANASCGINSDSTIKCWGQTRNGITRPPSGDFVEVSGGDDLFCARDTSDQIVCWGSNVNGESSPPDGAYDQVSASGNYACAIPKGTQSVECWGYEVQPFPEETSVVAVRAGFSAKRACVRNHLDRVVCWAHDDTACKEMADDGSTCDRHPVIADVPDTQFAELSVGVISACGLRDGRVECWGEGQVVDSPPAGAFETIKVGNRFGCGILMDETISCWGSARFQRTDPPSGTFRDLGVGNQHGCAITTTGTMKCWGDDEFGEASPPDPG